MRQTSAESEGVFDFLMALFQENWEELAAKAGLSETDVEVLLDYAAMFCANIGNYRVRL